MERLNRFAIASSHPTCTAAAAAMGIENSILTTQIKRLGEEFGGPLITRAYRNHPMTTTDLGAQVLRAWKKWAGKIESDPPRV
jgi:DNA-binding transcriptional LysR family regulator